MNSSSYLEELEKIDIDELKEKAPKKTFEELIEDLGIDFATNSTEPKMKTAIQPSKGSIPDYAMTVMAYKKRMTEEVSALDTKKFIATFCDVTTKKPKNLLKWQNAHMIVLKSYHANAIRELDVLPFIDSFKDNKQLVANYILKRCINRSCYEQVEIIIKYLLNPLPNTDEKMRKANELQSMFTPKTRYYDAFKNCLDQYFESNDPSKKRKAETEPEITNQNKKGTQSNSQKLFSHSSISLLEEELQSHAQAFLAPEQIKESGSFTISSIVGGILKRSVPLQRKMGISAVSYNKKTNDYFCIISTYKDYSTWWNNFTKSNTSHPNTPTPLST